MASLIGTTVNGNLTVANSLNSTGNGSFSNIVGVGGAATNDTPGIDIFNIKTALTTYAPAFIQGNLHNQQGTISVPYGDTTTTFTDINGFGSRTLIFAYMTSGTWSASITFTFDTAGPNVVCGLNILHESYNNGNLRFFPSVPTATFQWGFSSNNGNKVFLLSRNYVTFSTLTAYWAALIVGRTHVGYA